MNPDEKASFTDPLLHFMGVLFFSPLACSLGANESRLTPTPIKDIGVTLESAPWRHQLLGGLLVDEMGGCEILAPLDQVLIHDAERIYTNTQAVDFDPQNNPNLFMIGLVPAQPTTLEQIFAETLEELDLETVPRRQSAKMTHGDYAQILLVRCRMGQPDGQGWLLYK